MCLNCKFWFEAIDTMKSSCTYYLQVISWERLPIRSMGLFKIFLIRFFDSTSINEWWTQYF